MSWFVDAEPRAWQAEALRAWTEKEYHGVVSVVTGGGKTIFASYCMLLFRARFPDARFVIVVPTLALMDQWYVSLVEDCHVPDAEIATYSSEGSPREAATVNILVLNSARKYVKELCVANSLIIVDECHRAATPENSKSLAGNWSGTLGMSATPIRQYDAGFDDFIRPTLGPIIYEYDYIQAWNDKVIVPFDLVNVRVPLLVKEQERYDALTRRIIRLMKASAGQESPDAIKALLRQRAAVSSSASLRIPAAIRLLDDHVRQRSLVFHERISAAEEIQVGLNARGHNATLYNSRIAGPLRRDNLRLFRRGVFDALVSCRALDEGINVPETTVAVIAASTSSTRQRIQRLGRVLRPASGKDRASIYTIFATDVEERRLEAEATELREITTVDWRRMSIPT